MNINIRPDGAIKRVHVSQNDVGRTLTFELFNNSTSYTIPIGATVKIQGTKPSGFGFSETCTVSGNVATVDTTEAMTDEFGYIEAELQITNSGDVLGTSNFVLVVERNPHPDNTTDGTQITAQSLQVQIDELADIIENGDIDVDVEAQIAQYIDEHNIDGVTDEEVQAMVESYLDESMGESVADYLDAHPELITNVQDGSITLAKLASDVVAKIEDGGEKMATTVPVGKLFDTGYVYSSWVHNNVKYDAINDVICVMVNNSNSHTSATYRDVILYKLNPRTLKVEDIIEVNKSATSGEQFEVYGFDILSNGTYMFLPCYDTAVASASSNKLMVWSSSDYGETWTSTEATVTSLTSQTAYEWFGLTQLSSGMLLCTEYKTKSILHSSDNGATWIAQAMGNSTHEPTFIDCGNNKVICYCRKTMYGTSNGAWNGTKQIEPAVYHTSTDGGVTWTYKGNSATITEMTACNCACVVADGYADLYVCSRMPHGDAQCVIYHHFATLDDVFEDNWGSAKVVTYPTAPSSSDFGYIGATIDSVGIQHIFYYDSDTADLSEIRYIMASRQGVPVPTNSDKSEALAIPYSRSKTDALLSAMNARLTAKINDIIIAGGGTIDDEMDGSYFVTNGLFDSFEFKDASKYDQTTYTFSGLKNNMSLIRSSANWGQQAPSDTTLNANGVTDWLRFTSSADYHTSLNITDGFSFEFMTYCLATQASNYSDSVSRIMIGTKNQNTYYLALLGASVHNALYYVDTSSTNKSTSLSSYVLNGLDKFIFNNNVDSYRHFVVVADTTSLKVYQDGVAKYNITYSDIADFSSLRSEILSGFMSTTNMIQFGGNSGVFSITKARFYSKTLTEAEVKNNYKYESSMW